MISRILVAMLFAAGLSAQTPSPVTKVVETYCSGCHDGRVEPTGTRLTPFDPAHIAASPELWSRAERHLRAGTMPPVGARRPDRDTYDEVIAAIERELDTPAPAAETSQAIATRMATLLVSDTSVLIDLERGGLLKSGEQVFWLKQPATVSNKEPSRCSAAVPSARA